jgi:hypothetical protein
LWPRQNSLWAHLASHLLRGNSQLETVRGIRPVAHFGAMRSTLGAIGLAH